MTENLDYVKDSQQRQLSESPTKNVASLIIMVWRDSRELARPTAKRVVWLALLLPNEWTRIYMDNLLNSKKLFAALYQAKALAHGVA
jgi:hypothetical protein